MIQDQTAAEFRTWAGAQSVPEGFDTEMAILNSLNNTGDVPESDVLEVAKSTFRGYVDAGVSTF